MEELITSINQTTEVLKHFISVMDAEEQEIKKQRHDHNILVDGMSKSGKYTANYIDEVKKNFTPNHDAKKKITDARKQARQGVAIDYIKQCTENLINSPIRPDFATKINTYYQTKMPISNTEFEILKKGCNFTELQLLSHLGKSRTKEQTQMEVDPSNAGAKATKTSIADPFIIDIPSPETLSRAVNDYISSVNNCINNYCGADASLMPYTDVSLYFVGGANGYFRNNADETLKAIFEKIEPVTEKIERTAPTQTEQHLLDVVMDACFTDVDRNRIKEYVQKDDSLSKIFKFYS